MRTWSSTACPTPADSPIPVTELARSLVDKVRSTCGWSTPSLPATTSRFCAPRRSTTSPTWTLGLAERREGRPDKAVALGFAEQPRKPDQELPLQANEGTVSVAKGERAETLADDPDYQVYPNVVQTGRGDQSTATPAARFVNDRGQLVGVTTFGGHRDAESELRDRRRSGEDVSGRCDGDSLDWAVSVRRHRIGFGDECASRHRIRPCGPLTDHRRRTDRSDQRSTGAIREDYCNAVENVTAVSPRRSDAL